MSENQVTLQIRIFVTTMCLHMCMYTYMRAELYVRQIASESLFTSTYYVYASKVSSRVLFVVNN